MSPSRRREISEELEKDRQELQEALDQTIEDTIRQAWKVNALAWLAVAGGSFAINLLLLMLISGG